MFGLMRARTCTRHTEAWRKWRNHYCGTCKTIGARYGEHARMALNHDTVFLAELLTDLSGAAPELSKAYRSFNCMTMPREEAEMPLTMRYASAATLVLGEFKVADHVADTGRRRWRYLARLFSAAFRRAQADLRSFQFPLDELKAALAAQERIEGSKDSTLQDFARPTARATELFFAHGTKLIGKDLPVASRIGYRFGELAYLLDAFEDYDRDAASGAFNALRSSGMKPSDAVPLLRSMCSEIGAMIAELPIEPAVAASYTARLQSNLDAKLGLHVCKPRRFAPKKKTAGARWNEAVEFARKLTESTPRWRASATAAAVAVVAFLVPSQSRAAETPGECLSLGFNLMALGSVFALVTTRSGGGDVPLPGGGGPEGLANVAGEAAKEAIKGKAGKGGKGSSCCGCDSCDGCDACDACDCACCSCECCSCEMLSGCGECGSCCGGCGDCCGSCDCGGCDC